MRKAEKIATVYAQAALELASGSSAMESLGQELQQVSAALFADANVRNFFGSPLISSGEKWRLLEKVLKDFSGTLLYNFLGVLVARGRMQHLPEIVIAYGEALDKALNRKRVEVQSSVAIQESQLESLRKILKKQLNAEIILELKENPDLIGGLKLLTGDIVMDNSIKSSLKRIRTELLKRKTIGEEYYEN